MSEVDWHLKTLTQLLMAGEFLAVVDGQCLAQPRRDDAECSFFGGVQTGTGTVLHLRGDQKSAFAFDAGHDRARVTCTVNRVAFPVAEAAA